MTVSDSAQQIAESFASIADGRIDASDLELAILRHMEHHIKPHLATQSELRAALADVCTEGLSPNQLKDRIDRARKVLRSKHPEGLA